MILRIIENQYVVIKRVYLFTSDSFIVLVFGQKGRQGCFGADIGSALSQAYTVHRGSLNVLPASLIFFNFKNRYIFIWSEKVLTQDTCFWCIRKFHLVPQNGGFGG